MSYSKPFHRIYRNLVPRSNSGYSSWAFIVDKDYAVNPHHYTRAFFILQTDIINLFEYIEPSDINLQTYSYKIHELLIRTCIEVEANFKAILRENIYTPVFKTGNKTGQPRTEEYWKIGDYLKVNRTHHLQDYVVGFPFWRGERCKVQPFFNWEKQPLSWYQAYNECKHDRDRKFEKANFENLINAFAALFVLLSAQFNCENFSTGGQMMAISTDRYFDGEFGIGGYLKIEFPSNWKESEVYDFDWSELKKEEIRFQKFDYNTK
jgi:hypothetical protein